MYLRFYLDQMLVSVIY